MSTPLPGEPARPELNLYFLKRLNCNIKMASELRLARCFTLFESLIRPLGDHSGNATEPLTLLTQTTAAGVDRPPAVAPRGLYRCLVTVLLAPAVFDMWNSENKRQARDTPGARRTKALGDRSFLPFLGAMSEP